MNDTRLTVRGGCYCQRVQYRASGVRREVTECHCTQCRKQSGHRYASTGTRASEVEIDGAQNITWFRASEEAERGFCSTCGSTLFWKPNGRDYLGILAASIEDSEGLEVTKHIFVEDKGTYYEISDGLPQFAGYDTPMT